MLSQISRYARFKHFFAASMGIFLLYICYILSRKEIDQAPNSNISSVDEENSDGEQPGVRTTGKSDTKIHQY